MFAVLNIVRKQAIGAQFCTAIGALLGCILGLMSARWAGAEATLLGFTAGVRIVTKLHNSVQLVYMLLRACIAC
jgi:zinc transporter ZupT